MDAPGKALVALALLAIVMAVIQRRWPASSGQRRTLRDTITDLAYLLVNPLLSKPLTRIAVLACAGIWAALVAGSLRPEELVTAFSSRSPIGAQPLWLQGIELVLLGDFIGYWVHRGFHSGWLWRVHAVHHSPERLDWLSSVRVHPLNDVLGTLLRVIPLFLLGFRLDALAVSIPGLLLYGLLIHANVWWRFGPLRWVVTTPAFHRWHHAHPDALPESMRAHGANFATVLPVWDMIFGTYHLPDHPPARCGIDGPMPAGVIGQLRHPFRRASQSSPLQPATDPSCREPQRT